MPLTSRMSCQPSRVVVEERAAGAERFGQQLAAVGAAVVAELKAGRGGDVDQAEAGSAEAAHAQSAPKQTPRPQPTSRADATAQKVRAGSRQIHQSVADGVDHEFGGLVDAQRVHDVGAMDGDGVGAEFERRGDFLVRLPVARSAAGLPARAG